MKLENTAHHDMMIADTITPLLFFSSQNWGVDGKIHPLLVDLDCMIR
jgi:hypothetical protein